MSRRGNWGAAASSGQCPHPTAVLAAPLLPGRLQELHGEDVAGSVLSYDRFSLMLTGTTQLNRKLSFPAAAMIASAGALRATSGREGARSWSARGASSRGLAPWLQLLCREAVLMPPD